MYVHAHGRRPQDTTMSKQQEDTTAVRKAALGEAVMAELLAIKL